MTDREPKAECTVAYFASNIKLKPLATPMLLLMLLLAVMMVMMIEEEINVRDI